MARLVLPLSGSLPRSESLKKVIRFLVENLPPVPAPKSLEGLGLHGPEYVVLPVLAIPDEHARQVCEIDIVLIAPHAVFVLDIKDWGPQIQGDDEFWCVDGTRERRNPFRSLHFKTESLRTLVGRADTGLYRRTSFRELVVLARDSVQLNVNGASRWPVLPMDDRLLNRLTDPGAGPSDNLLESDSLSDQKQLAEILHRWGAYMKPPLVVHGHRLCETLAIEPGLTEYLARSLEPQQEGQLRRIRVITLPFLNDRARQHERAERIGEDWKAFERIGPHPNIVGCAEYYDETNDQVVQVLERAEENTLRSRMLKGTLGPDATLRIVEGVARGLDACHRNGVVHGELCPGDILLTASGPRIMNFRRGLLSPRDLLPDWPIRPERENHPYIAPERALFPDDHPVSPSADLYSLGAVFYQMLCGEPPFPHPDAFYDSGGKLPVEWLPSRRNGSIPSWIDGVIGRLCTGSRERYRSAGELLADLEAGMRLRTDSVQAEPDSTPPFPWHRSEGAPLAIRNGDLGHINLLRIADLFQNTDLDDRLDETRSIHKKDLINDINFINFQDQSILVNFRHKKYESLVSLRAKPLPCLGETLDCRLTDPLTLHDHGSYDFLNLILTDGLKIVLVKPDLKGIEGGVLRFELPETSHELRFRKSKRYPCRDVEVEFIQAGAVLSGSLIEFSAVSFRIEVTIVPPQSFLWVNPKATATIIFRKEGRVVFSGECRITRESHGQKTRTFVLRTISDNIRRFKPKAFRSIRLRLSPTPNLIFRHPLTGRMVNLEIEDISGGGVSVEESCEDSVLLTGMIVPEIEIEFANGFKITCTGQVVYRNADRNGNRDNHVRCGMAFLDMNVGDQVRLSSVLHRAADQRSYVCGRVDLDALWKFFFETGFFYPRKYALIHANKEKLKDTYEKLYLHSPEIVKHFTYQEKGAIHGHISMVRFYDNTWLFHHHAATGSWLRKAGIVVLEQIGRYVNDFACLYSTHMNFIISYYRPENRFPNRVFGGFTKSLNDPRGASLNRFAYLHLHGEPASLTEPAPLSEDHELHPTQPEDLLELGSFYEHTSGGLLLYALDLHPDMIRCSDLNKEYRRLGFKRERHLFSLKKGRELKAVIMITRSDIGLNLSNLTNCMHVIVLDQDNLPGTAFLSALGTLIRRLRIEDPQDFPILLYPVSYAESRRIPFEKQYDLWVFNSQYSDQYFSYMENLLSRSRRKQEQGSGITVI